MGVEGRVIDSHREREASKYADSVFTGKYGAASGLALDRSSGPPARRPAGRQADLLTARSNIRAA